MSIASTYASQRDEMTRAMAAHAPGALLHGLTEAAERLAAVDFASRAPRIGDAAPEFTLPDQNGDEVALSALLRSGPVVLIFYRGEWCPYCNLQLRTFQRHIEQLDAYGAQLVAISPQTPDHSLSMAEKNELGFHVLSDVGAQVIERYGLRYEVDGQTRQLLEGVGSDIGAHNGGAGWVLPAAATFVIGSRGEVRYAHVRGDWRERAEPSDVLAVLATSGEA
jgi:peroxiredoxin